MWPTCRSTYDEQFLPQDRSRTDEAVHQLLPYGPYKHCKGCQKDQRCRIGTANITNMLVYILVNTRIIISIIMTVETWRADLAGLNDISDEI